MDRDTSLYQHLQSLYALAKGRMGIHHFGIVPRRVWISGALGLSLCFVLKSKSYALNLYSCSHCLEEHASGEAGHTGETLRTGGIYRFDRHSKERGNSINCAMLCLTHEKYLSYYLNR